MAENVGDNKVLVTGGAGFIGSHLVDFLAARGAEVTVIDNLSSGRYEFVEPVVEQGKAEFIKEDILEADLARLMKEKAVDLVFHVAANPDVRLGKEDTRVHMEQNVNATYRVLEAMRQAEVGHIAFTSTSTVYGEADERPTPENYGPLIPISLYGASKLAAESFIAAYCGTFDMRATIYRFANCVGPRSTHGVTYDFVHKLLDDPRKLEILGDGTQTKSYVYIEDVIKAMIWCCEHGEERCGVYNIGSRDAVDVRTIADTVAEAMGLGEVEYEFTGGVDGGRGWKGDVKFMSLAVNKLEALGYRPRYDSAEAIRMTARHIYEEAEKGGD